MTPNATSAATAAAVVALTLLGSLVPTSSFVPVSSRSQTSRPSRRSSPSSHFSTPPPLPQGSAAGHSRRQRRHPTPNTSATGRRRQRTSLSNHGGLGGELKGKGFQKAFPGSSRPPRPSPFRRGCGRRRVSSLSPLAVGGMDGIDMDEFDSLEVGPDPDAILLQGEPELLRQQQDEEDYEAELAAAGAATAAAENAPTKKEVAEAAVAAAVEMAGGGAGAAGGASDEMAMAGIDPKKKKKATRVRIDPLMPRGGVAPNEWLEMGDLAEGTRGILVICHTGLPKDKKRASEIIHAVKERYGHVIHTHEWWDDDEELTEDDREETGTFEVWLEGPTVVHYHERADGKVDLNDEQLGKILDDLEDRVVDEAILGLYVNEDIQFRLPGFKAAEQRSKQFPDL